MYMYFLNVSLSLSLSLSLTLSLYPLTISAMEAAFILSNLARHSTYIKATATHLLSHVRSNEDMIGPHLLPNERERLTSDLSGAAAAVSSLQEEVMTLQREVNLVGWCPFVDNIILSFMFSLVTILQLFRHV